MPTRRGRMSLQYGGAGRLTITTVQSLGFQPYRRAQALGDSVVAFITRLCAAHALESLPLAS